MDGEVLFRKSVIGGFNREDVMNYIAQIKVEKDALDSTSKKLEAAQKELEERDAVIEKLTAKISEFETQLSEFRQNAQPVKSEFDITADKLMRDSMVYAQRYVDSAELMAKNIREDIIVKVSDADLKLSGMHESVNDLIEKSKEFDATLKEFKADFEAIQSSFEEDKKSE